MIWVGIFGAKGYFGEELSKLIAGHQSAQVSTMLDLQELNESGCGFSRGNGKSAGYLKMMNAINRADIIFNGFSGTVAEDIYSKALSNGKKIIDVGDKQHIDGSAYPGSVFGLSELYKDKMKNASIAANPSSYCTGAMLGLAPLAAGNLIDINTAVIESKSGISYLRCGDKLECAGITADDGSKIYKMESRDYAEEVKGQMLALFGKEALSSYVSYIIPGIKGIITSITAEPGTGFGGRSISEVYRDFYKFNPLIEVGGIDTINGARNGFDKYFCSISASTDADTGKITVTTILNDVVRGSASQAVQTMNLMYGIEGIVGL